TPFQDARPAVRPSMHLSQEPPALERRRPDVPADVASVVRKMMAKRPDDRYHTPGYAAEALAALPGGKTGGGSGARGRPVPPPPPGSLPTTVVLSNKQRRGAGTGLLAALLGVALLLPLGCVGLVVFVPPLLRDREPGKKEVASKDEAGE